MAQGQPIPTRWHARWALLTAGCALSMTGLDALLQDRKYGLFTGGYLAPDHLDTLPKAATFVATSLAADAALIGAVVALGLWACARLQWPAIASSVVIAVAGLGPPAAIDFFAYQIAEYLGTAFDFDLLWQLNGGRPEEMFAVASSHLIAPLMVLLAGALTLGWAGRLVHRGLPQEWKAAWTDRPRGMARALPLGVFVAGLAATSLTAAGSETVQTAVARKPTGRALQQLIGPLSDLDGDGYGLLRRPSDPAPRDSRIYPYAVDVPGDGIDQNGLGGDLPAAEAAFDEGPPDPPRWASTPDVVVVVLESVRWDAFDALERGRPVMPVLRALAAEGIVSPAYAHASFTAPSWHHLFSGTVANMRGGTTLADDFKANGYEVAYFSAQDQSYGGSAMPDGFDRADVAYDARQDVDRRFTTFATSSSIGVPFTVIQERVGAFLERRQRSRPLLLVVNFQDSHFPYHHAGIRPLLNDVVVPQGEISAGRTAEIRAMYRNTVANVDLAVGEVLRRAKSALAREPAVIVTSDHGESLFEEGFLGHGYALNDVQSRVPFIVTNLPLVIEQPFGQADLRAAISAALGQAAGTRPSVRVNSDKAVFQYVGTLDRPRQIGWVTTTGRLSYDFAYARARVDSGAWVKPDSLSTAHAAELQRLVRWWERMMLARERTGRRGPH